MMSTAGTQPKDLGLAAELWTMTSLTRYIAQHGPEAGHPRLGRMSRASVHRILNDHELKPHRVRYYLERRDPDFEAKMREVLMVYREVFLRGDRPWLARKSHQELSWDLDLSDNIIGFNNLYKTDKEVP